MSDSMQPSAFSSQIYVTSTLSGSQSPQGPDPAERRHTEMMEAIRELTAQQQELNQLFRTLLNAQAQPARQRAQELSDWRASHARLSRDARWLLGVLADLQVKYYGKIIEDGQEHCDTWEDSEFMFHDFLDKFGPHLMHLNSIMGSLDMIASPPNQRPERPEGAD